MTASHHLPQSKKKLERTKKVLQLATASYIVLLLLMSTFDMIELAMVVQLGAIGLGLTACGSGAAKVSIGWTEHSQQSSCCEVGRKVLVINMQRACTHLIVVRMSNSGRYPTRCHLTPPPLPPFLPPSLSLKLCNTLRALGESSASIADTVFKVSRSMGISLCEWRHRRSSVSCVALGICPPPPCSSIRSGAVSLTSCSPTRFFDEVKFNEGPRQTHASLASADFTRTPLDRCIIHAPEYSFRAMAY